MTGSALKAFCAFFLGTAATILPAAGQDPGSSAVSGPAKASCMVEARPDRLEAVTPQGDLVLASAGLAKLADLRIPDGATGRDRALTWLRQRIDRPVLVQGGERRDRWGRMSVRIRFTDASAPLDAAQALVEAGLALVDPAPGEVFCQFHLLALEREARERGLGLWADDGYNPIQAEQMDRLQDRVGRFALIEGRVRSVGERRQQTYLNFGGHWAEDFTIIIPQKTWKLMAERGLDAEALRGRRIRARGILQSWQCTALTIVIPEMIELLEGRPFAR